MSRANWWIAGQVSFEGVRAGELRRGQSTFFEDIFSFLKKLSEKCGLTPMV
jgi:hypothetical protein